MAEITNTPLKESAELNSSTFLLSRELNSLPLVNSGNLKAYYRLESNFTDSSASGYNLSATGTPGDVTGKFGNAKSFVINTSYASITNASGPNLGVTGKSFSIAAWVYPTNVAAGWQYIASKRSGNDGFYLALSGGTIPIVLIGNGSTTVTAQSSTNVVDNRWYHIAATYDGINLRIYVDGILEREQATTISMTAATGVPFYIGCNSNNTAEGLTGRLDDVAVFNRPLTQDEIFSLCNVNPTDLKLYYRFEETSGTSVTDTSGNSNTGTASASSILNNSSGRFGKKAVFASASSNKITITQHSSLQPTGKFSYGMWFKTSNSASTMGLFVNYHNNSAVSGFKCIMLNGEVRTYIGKNTGTVDGTDYRFLASAQAGWADGAWHHLAYTWDGITVRLYLDGVLNNSAAWSQATVYNANTVVRVGVDYDTSEANFYNGDLDDLFLFNGIALSDAQVRQMFLGPTAYYRLEDTTDSTSFGRNLTNVNSATFAAGKYSNGVDFGSANTNKYLTTTSPLNIDGGRMSVSMWVKITTAPASTFAAVFFDQGNTTSKVHNRVFYSNNGGLMQLLFRRTKYGVSNIDVSVDQTLTVGTWYHIVYTYDGTYVRGYINGVLVGAPAVSTGNGTSGGETGFRIGHGLADYTSPTSGMFDDVAVYNRTLTDAEVLSLYFEGGTNTLYLQPNYVDGMETGINAATATTNYGNDEQNSAGTDSTNSSFIERFLIKFDLSSIPAGSIINSATLNLKLWQVGSFRAGNNRTGRIYRMLRAWVETEATWNIAQTSTNWGTAGAANTTTDRESTDIGSTTFKTTDAVDTYKPISLTPSAIQDMITGGSVTNRGFMLKMDTETSDRYFFHTSDSTTADHRPRLIINYTPPPTSQGNSVKGNIAHITVTQDNSAKGSIKQVTFPNAMYARANILGATVKKRYSYKLYYSNSDIRDVWGDELLSDPSFRMQINSGPGEVVVRLARKVDAFGEGDDIVLNRRIDIYVHDREAPNGLLLYQGYLSSYAPILDGAQEYVEITILGYVVEIGQRILKDGSGNTTLNYLSSDPSNIMKDVIDKYRADGGNLRYTSDSIQMTNSSVTYQFSLNTIKEVFDKIIELTPYDWYWRIDPDGVVYLRQRQATPLHKFFIGRHISYMRPERRIESLRNVLYLVGGTPPGDAQLFRKYTRTSSIATYGLREDRLTDQRVTLASTADTKAARYLAERDTPETRTVLRIADSAGEDPNKGYDIESIKPGDTISIENLKSSVKTLSLWDQMIWDQANWDFETEFITAETLHVITVNYTSNQVELEAARALPSVAKRIEDIERNVSDLTSSELPVAPVTA